MKSNSWMKTGLILGAVFFISILLIKPIGASTQFSVLSGMIHNAVDNSVIYEDPTSESGYASTNEYYNKNNGALAKSIANPLNYDMVFFFSIPLGAGVGYFFNKRRKKNENDIDIEESSVIDCDLTPQTKPSFFKNYGPPFIGGFLLLFGARLADGCTSGHMVSGMMQGSVSGYIFAASVFAIAIPTAIFVGKLGKKKGV